MGFHEDHPFGSARFATVTEVRRAFRNTGGIPIGFFGGRLLFHSRQAGALLIGGAGSGKFVSVLAHIMADLGRGCDQPPRYAILDPKGELAAVIGRGLVHAGAHVYCINPYRLHGLPNHSVALLAHLLPGSPLLVADSRRVAMTLLPDSGSGEARFFEHKAQNWLDALLRGLVHLDGGVSLVSLYELVGMIRAAPDSWTQTSAAMAAKGEPDLAVTYAEMLGMAEDSRKTYDSVMAEISNGLAFMADPALQRTFTGKAAADLTLDVLTETSNRPVYVFLIMPAELIAQNAALIRQFFSTLRTLKQRRPDAPTLNLVMDEAARLGRFPEIAEFYSIGRGFGLSPLAVYQDIGQIRENLGPKPMTSCWSKGCRQHYAYYLCDTKGCASYRKSIPRAKIEDGFEDILRAMQPRRELFAVARAMLCEVWDDRLARAHQGKAALMQRLTETSKMIDGLLDRIVETTSPTIIGAYERKIEALEMEKIVLAEKIDSATPPKGRLEEFIELALNFLSSPWDIYNKGGLALKRTVLRLAFSEPVRYTRETGYRTVETALPFRVLASLSHQKSEMVRSRRTGRLDHTVA